MFPATSIRIVIRAVSQFVDDNASAMGAALAYYALFSLAPLLILAVLIAGSVYGEEAARDRVVEHFTEALGPEVAQEVARILDHALGSGKGRLAAGLGLAALVFGAVGAFLHVRYCLSRIWRLRPVVLHGLVHALLNYCLALVMVFSVALLLVVSLAISTLLPLLGEETGPVPLLGMPRLHALDAGVSVLLLSLFFALVYRVLSARRISWGYSAYGAIVSAVLFTIGKIVIGRYLASTTTASAYGAAGSLVLFLIWVYYSAQMFFFGAEMIQARRTRAEWMYAGAMLPVRALPPEEGREAMASAPDEGES